MPLDNWLRLCRGWLSSLVCHVNVTEHSSHTHTPSPGVSGGFPVLETQDQPPAELGALREEAATSPH